MGKPRLPSGPKKQDGRSAPSRGGPVENVPPEMLGLIERDLLRLSAERDFAEILRAIDIADMTRPDASTAELRDLTQRVGRARQLVSGVSEDLRVLVWLDTATAGIARELRTNADHYARHPELLEAVLKFHRQAFVARFPRFASLDFAGPYAEYIGESAKALRRGPRTAVGCRSSKRWEALRSLAERLRLHGSAQPLESFKRTVWRAKTNLRGPGSPKVRNRK